MGIVDDRLDELELVLPPYPAPLASYAPFVRCGNLLYLSGHVPFKEDCKTLHTGRVGRDLTTAEASSLARHIGLEMVTTLKSAVGDLDKVERIVKLVGFVQCEDDYTEQPEVINGCSDLLQEIFGDKGVHARSAVGTNALPRQVPVEIEMIAEIRD